MAHRRKKRAASAPGHVPNAHAKGVTKSDPAQRIPKSMVIRMGASDVGASVSQLVKDVRNIMEPHTASRLKERRSNRLRDYTTMAGPLGVSHFLLFSRSPAGNTNMRLAIAPRGPTLNFRVEKYSLCKDVVKSLRRPKAAGGTGVEHLTPPLLVMNNFTNPNSTSTTPIPKHLETLTTSVFQSMFPPISPQQTPLKSIRRVLLLNRETPASSSAEDEGTYIVNLRHYSITTKRLVPMSRGLKRIRAAEQHIKPHPNAKSIPTTTTKQPSKVKSRSSANLPDMSRLDDVADYILDPAAAGGYTSASETEVDTDAEVEVVEPEARQVTNRQRARPGPATTENGDKMTKPHRTQAAPPVQRKAVKLTEIGPRLKLRLVKVEEGLCQGRVIWHEFVTKTDEEIKDLDAVWEQRKQEKEERRRVQRENVEKKKKKMGVVGEGEKQDDQEIGYDEFDDDEWYEDEDEDMLDDDARYDNVEGEGEREDEDGSEDEIA